MYDTSTQCRECYSKRKAHLYPDKEWQAYYRSDGTRGGYLYDKCKCGNLKVKGSKTCIKCYHKRNKDREWQASYDKNGKKRGYIYDKCKCGNIKVREAEVCRKCYLKAMKTNAKKTYIRLQHGIKRTVEHRIIAAKVLGRKLITDEVVHHINMNKQDNRNSNLLICSGSYHRWLHTQYSKQFAKNLS